MLPARAPLSHRATAQRWRSKAVALLLAAIGLMMAARARAADVQLTWLPVGEATGYRVYVRQETGQWLPGLDAGRPPPGADGAIRYVVRAVPGGAVSYFAVTAYDALGNESAFSNQLSLAIPANSPTPGGPTPTRTATRTPTRTPTRTGTPTWTSTRPPTSTLVPTATPTASPSPTPTATATPTTDPASWTLSGRLRHYGTAADVAAVLVDLYGDRSGRATSDALGRFGFTLPAGGALQIEPEKADGIGAAVSALDAAYVLQAVSGLRSLDLRQRLACDVTGDGTLSALDAALILQFTVGILPRFPVVEACGSAWAFVPEPRQLENGALIQPQVNSSGCQRGGVLFYAFDGSAPEQDFAAIPFGDCTANWTAE